MSEDLLQAARTCDLHVHIGGCVTIDDLIELGGPMAEQIDWSLYIDAYVAAFGIRPDPADWVQRAAGGDDEAIQQIRDHYIYTEADGADFTRFMAKFNFAIALLRHQHSIGNYDECVARAIDGQRRQGINYVEMRAWTPAGAGDPVGFLRFHQRNARIVAACCQPGFTARYVPSIPRSEPLAAYRILRQGLDEDVDFASVVVGLDFCHFEEGFPPRTTRAFFDRFHADEAVRQDRPALDVLYHVGEIFFDKTLESAIRWCHEAAELGARRLGHCIALGLDPAVAINRRQDAHACESVAERLDQIDYDLRHRAGLEAAGVETDAAALVTEGDGLRHQPPEAIIRRDYDERRLEHIRRRQDFVLADLARRGTVIESCPSSNMRLGSVPNAATHPIHRFLASDVALAIGADDPGIFDSPLTAEVDWVDRATSLTHTELADRLGDPRRFACGRDRNDHTGMPHNSQGRVT